MEIDLFKLYSENTLLMIFSLIALGLIVGKIKLGVIELGSTTGVLLVGLLFGHLGFKANDTIGSIGFAIFIFAVGIQAGPSFFSVFMEDGIKYIALALTIATTSLGVALLISKVLHLDYGLAAGLLAGSLTSTPTLAGAQDAITSGLASIPEGMTNELAAQNVSIAYAITYLFGTIGLILVIRYFPRLVKVDLVNEAREFSEKKGFKKKLELESSANIIPIIRAYLTPEKAVGKSLLEIKNNTSHNIILLKIRRANKILNAEDSLTLESGDIISTIASLGEHEKHKEILGKEILDAELLNYDVSTKEIIIMKDYAVGKTIANLDVCAQYGCFIRGVNRSSINLKAEPNLVLQKGDRIYLTGEYNNLHKVAESIGLIESEEVQTDFLSFSLGIGFGTLLGLLMFKIGNVSIGLGTAGGLLFTGILIGFIRSMRPTFGGVPPAALRILMEFGLTMFMAGVGLKAGAGIVEGFMNAGPVLLISGVVVTLTPLFIGYIFGVKILKMNPALLLGAITGSMTSTPALNIVTDAAKSDTPALGYAGTYTFANVLLTFAGTIMMAI